MLINNNNTKKHHKKNNYNEIADVSNPFYNNPGFNNISGLGDDGDDALVSDSFNETKDWGNDDDSAWKSWNDSENVEDEIKEFDLDTDQSSNLNILEDASNGLESDIINPYTYQMTEKIKELKKQLLEKQHSQLTVTEYNYKRIIFEYFILLNSNNNGYGQMDISLEIAQKIFINGDNELFPTIGIAKKKIISIRTAIKLAV
ncbi:hypothetical protein GLOIN_2v1791416 [Rhizophagus irregularis DAOM 181602=DAOM 197198]|nr:hypothetical protein GLOIN_2v1791416 [Rhizophagus irregularis DAOM 181602=DAOM 197198]